MQRAFSDVFAIALTTVMLQPVSAFADAVYVLTGPELESRIIGHTIDFPDGASITYCPKQGVWFERRDASMTSTFRNADGKISHRWGILKVVGDAIEVRGTSKDPNFFNSEQIVRVGGQLLYRDAKGNYALIRQVLPARC